MSRRHRSSRSAPRRRLHLRGAFSLALTLSLGLALVSSCGGGDDTPAGPDAARIDASTIDAPTGDGGIDAAVDAAVDAPVSNETCTVTAGDGRKLITGTVLAPTGIIASGQVAINAAGMITCVGASCAQGGETRIDCPMGVISPGLINTHDHITYTQNAPYTDTGERYEQRHDWRTGRRGHTEINTPGSATADQIRWGELRFLLGGATSIVGSGGQAGLLRNLDQAANQEGLGQAAVKFETFPLDDSSGTQRDGDCNYGGTADTTATVTPLMSYEPHISEGIDRVARNEFLCTSTNTFDTTAPGLSSDLVLPQTAIIHGVGLKPFDYGVMAADGTALIWSPRSNITLYGDTAQVSVAARMGVEIALGTDWSATGSISLLRELSCADSFNRTYLNSYFTDEQLWKMVTINAASVTATDDVIGSLAVGKIADISIFDGRTRSGYRAVIGAEDKDVWLVMRAGKPLYGIDTVIAALTPSGCDTLDVCGEPKRVCLMSEVGKTYAALKTGAGASTYPAFFCGTPTNEPTCTPKRPNASNAVNGSTIYTGTPGANDLDGDGVPNASDNCMMVFNPVRPVDDGSQGDFDHDNVGDVCDPCPVNANTNQCTAVNPDDRDGDGVLNAIDNCPDNANATQADADGDMKGDVCDACPMSFNPGLLGCPATVYDIKNRGAATAVPLGSNVTVRNVIVTGKGSNGFFVQVKPGDMGFTTADYSGLFVFTGAGSPFLTAITVGNRVHVTGNVADFNGQIELDGVADVTVANAAVEDAPAPVVVTAAEATTGGARATKLEGVIVRTGTASITAINAAQGEFTAMEPGGGSLIVDDFLFLQPAPMVGQTFASMTGVLTWRNMASKLEPRSAADLPTGAPLLSALAPAQSYVRAGETMAPTIPTALTVTLSGPALADTFVAITSSNEAALTVVGGGVMIPAGQQSRSVLVNGLAQNPNVTLTATLGAVTKMANVRVLGGNEQPTMVTLTPMTATTTPGGTVAMTVTLDIPAPGDTQVLIAVNPANAGQVPAAVTVLADHTSQTFNYVDDSVAQQAMVTATLGASTSTATIDIVAVQAHLVINEIDYDMPGAGDAAEYVEIYNPGTQPVSLADYTLVLVNGSGTPAVYRTNSLAAAGMLPAGGYLVIGAAAVVPMGNGLKLTPPVGSANDQWPTTDAIQNGSTGISSPGDGVLLVNTATMTVVDKLSYESQITVTFSGALAGLGTVNLVEGTFTPVGDDPAAASAMIRRPNGVDTDDAFTDWAATGTLTPGAANPN